MVSTDYVLSIPELKGNFVELLNIISVYAKNFQQQKLEIILSRKQ